MTPFFIHIAAELETLWQSEFLDDRKKYHLTFRHVTTEEQRMAVKFEVKGQSKMLHLILAVSDW